MTTTRQPTRGERQAAMALAAQGAARMPPAPPTIPEPQAAPEPRREPTATDLIEALAARRMAGNGYIIPPPGEVTLKTAKEWLSQVAEAGSAGDVEIAWVRGIQNIHIKNGLAHEYERLRSVAGARHAGLEIEAAAERRVEHQAWVERTKAANLKRDIAAAEARLAALKAQE